LNLRFRHHRLRWSLGRLAGREPVPKHSRHGISRCTIIPKIGPPKVGRQKTIRPKIGHLKISRRSKHRLSSLPRCALQTPAVPAVVAAGGDAVAADANKQLLKLLLPPR
jgi:hypothetical protein